MNIRKNYKNKRSKKSRKRLTVDEEKKNQAGGTPVYSHFKNLGLLSRESLQHTPLGLTQYEGGFSDHIVSTSGGGNRKRRRRTRRRKRTNRRRSQRRR